MSTSRFSQINGENDRSVAVRLLGPLPKGSDDDEELLSKNNSSTILQFSLSGGGIGDKCRYLTGGDAEVAIWEKLWNLHKNRTEWLSYDVLLAPHHCSWHSISYDSQTELGGNAKVCMDAFNALSRARDGATIVASSVAIKDDGNDPPSIRAKQEYQKIVKSVSGDFKCVGEHPSERSLDILEIEITMVRSENTRWDRSNYRCRKFASNRVPTTSPWIGNSMASLNNSAAISRSLAAISRHRAIFQISQPEFDSTTQETVVDVTFTVNLPSEWKKKGESPSGVRCKEIVRLEFPKQYPVFPPRLTLRKDFSKNFPHILRILDDGTPVPCIYDGEVTELLHQRGFIGIVNQIMSWLERAAFNELLDTNQGWEPVRRDHLENIISCRFRNSPQSCKRKWRT